MELNQLIASFLMLEKNTIGIRQKKYDDILAKYASVNNFLSALKVCIINEPNDLYFKQLYDFYASFFTIPEETESFSGFQDTLRLNKDSYLQDKFGPFQEAWLYVKEPENENIIGGLNFSIYGLDAINSTKFGYDGTLHIIYIFVEPKYRGLGIAKFLLDLVDTHAANFLQTHKPLLHFCEQNAPELMDVESYFSDNINALVDQCDRLIWWDKLGYKRLAFNYIQPPLNKGQKPCLDLTLNVKTDMSYIPAALVNFHLERFFTLAVFKAQENLKDNFYHSQMKWLNENINIKTTGNIDYYKSIKSRIYSESNNWKPVKMLF